MNIELAFPLLSRKPWNTQIRTDLSSKLILDLAMSGNRGCRAGCGILVNGVLATFSNEEATVRFEVPDEVGSFHFVKLHAKSGARE